MENYSDKLGMYYRTLDFTNGTGSGGQSYIDDAYNDLCDAYDILEDKSDITLPKKHISARHMDGGYSVLRSNANRNFY